METTTVIDINQYKLDTTFYKDHLVHTVYPADQRLAPFNTTWTHVKHIGDGGFGSVCLEKEVFTGELRAVKKIYRPKSRNFDFSRELRALIMMGGYQNLFVQLFGWYEDDRGFIFIAMDYHENGDLGRYLKRFKSKARSEIKEITGQLLEGLVVLHQNHICHRDLKPNNVLIACYSPICVKLADFGTSKSTVNTFLRTRCGTSGYMAPEMLGFMPRGKGIYTTALDIWSLGCIIYEILTSEIPFLEKSVDTTTGENSTHDTTEIDMHLLSQFCSGNIDLPVECLRESGVSESRVDFLRKLLVADPFSRLSAIEALNSLWLFELPSELYQENSSHVLREQFRSLGLEFDAKTVDSLIMQCKERGDVDIIGILGYSDIRRLLSLISTAMEIGHTLVLELLLRTIQCLNPGNKIVDYGAAEGYLGLAAERGHLGIVKLLLEKGVDVNAGEDSDCTALHKAAKNGHLGVVRLLLGMGANAKTGGDIHRTVLHEAAKAGHLEVVRLLLQNGVDVNIQDNCGWAALNEAAKAGHLEVVRLLLQSGADVSIEDNSDQTVLCIAAKEGHLEIVRLLLQTGVDINIQDFRGWTALHEAARAGHPGVVRLLLENGADTKIRNHWGLTALEIAVNAKHFEIAALLENGADTNLGNHGLGSLA